MKRIVISLLVGASVVLCACESTLATESQLQAESQDLVSGEGYSYPAPSKSENVKPRLRPTLVPDVIQRQIVVDQINLSQDGSMGSFNVIVQAVGDNQKTLLFTVFGGEKPLNPFAARAFMARATSIVRTAPLIVQMGLGGQVDVFDVASAVGFDRIVVSDGYTNAHAFAFEN